MMTLSKILLYMGLVMLLMLPMSLAEMGSGQPGPGDKGMQRAGAPPSGVPVGMLISEHGVALKDNKTYALRIIVECLMPMEPRRVQKLLASNKSLEEIKAAIGAAQGEPMYHGSMKLDERIYPLINIRIASRADNISDLEADVAKPNQDPALVNEIAVVGHIRMTAAPSENGIAGKGELWMNDSYHPGTHSILIDIGGLN
jgi:hypothetical protein